MTLDMRVGALIDPHHSDAATFAGEAERVGVSSLWVPEVWGYDALTGLAYLAARTTTIGLGTFVDLRKAEFIGRDALSAEEAAGGPRLRLAGLELDPSSIVALQSSGGRLPLIPNRVWWYPLPVRTGEKLIGHATSVTWAPTVGKVVGFGHLEAGVDQGDSVEVEWQMGDVSGMVPATVVPLPFLPVRRSS